jgi:hypothetical protein
LAEEHSVFFDFNRVQLNCNDVSIVKVKQSRWGSELNVPTWLLFGMQAIEKYSIGARSYSNGSAIKSPSQVYGSAQRFRN